MLHDILGASVSRSCTALLASAVPEGWMQNYDPAHFWLLSTAWAALPLIVLLGTMIGLRIKGHLSALAALVAAFAVALGIFHMPARLAALSALYGAGYGLFPIFWVIFPVLMMYHLTVRSGRFALLKDCFSGITQDSRLQLILIAFLAGAFFEGAAGFGTPVAVCGTILLGLGFAPEEAAGLVLLADTVPVAFGSLGIPAVALSGVTGLDLPTLTRGLSALLTPFCVLLPFWLVWTFAGFRAMREVWPACMVAGVSFAFSQLLIAWFHGPWLVDIAAAVIALSTVVLFLQVWKPKRILDAQRRDITHLPRSTRRIDRAAAMRAAAPWIILALIVVAWGTPEVNTWLNASTLQIPVPGLDRVIFRTSPVVARLTPEPAIFTFNWLSATGTGIFIAVLAAAIVMKMRVKDIAGALRDSAVSSRFTMMSIAILMGLAFISRYCGLDVTIGLALARTGALYPFFGTLIGWLGTASTGSDTSSNVLFGNLQKFAAQKIGISPYIMAAANSAGGVMGKMIAPQSVVIATTTTGIYGSEGKILRFVFLHSLFFACLTGCLTLLAAYIPAIEHAVRLH